MFVCVCVQRTIRELRYDGLIAYCAPCLCWSAPHLHTRTYSLDADTQAAAAGTSGTGCLGRERRENGVFGERERREDGVFGGERERLDDGVFGERERREDGVFGERDGGTGCSERERDRQRERDGGTGRSERERER